MSGPDAVTKYLRDPRRHVTEGLEALHALRRRQARRDLWRAVLGSEARAMIARNMLGSYRATRKLGASRAHARDAADTIAHAATLAILGRLA